MGIPRATTHLRPYASLETVDGSATEPPEDGALAWRRRAIIDGPALVYHVYYTYLARPVTAASPPTSAPSCSPYRELGRAVLAWLDRLRRCGLTIERLYFDGALPPGKEKIRQARLQSSLRQLISFRSLHPNLAATATALWRSPTSRTTKGELDLGTVHARARHGRATLPAPVFLVAAALEALTATADYAPLTQVVPGEADAFCAAHARRFGGLIFTNDSDLLVYDLGSDAAVLFFADADFSEASSSADSSNSQVTHALRYLSYEPARIMRQMGLPQPEGLAAFAFELERDPTLGASSLLQRARARHGKGTLQPEFRAFLERYQLPGKELVWPKQPDSEREEPRGLKFLEPRVSELFHRYGLERSGTNCNLSSQETTKDLSMHLPFLLDDPTRSSAWQIGLTQRTLAYSLLNHSSLSGVRRAHLSEIGRRGQQMAAVEMPLLDTAGSLGFARDLCSKYDNLHSVFPGTSNKYLWTIFAMQEIIQAAVDSDKAPPTRAQLLRISNPESPTPDWSTVHLFAQMQAALYSLHMLRQVVKVVSSLTLPLELQNHSAEGPWEYLGEILDSLPTLTEGIPSKLDTGLDCSLLEPCREDIVSWLLRPTEEAEDVNDKEQERSASLPSEWQTQKQEKNAAKSTAGKRRKKKKKKPTSTSGPPLGSQTISSASNMFTVLTDRH